MKKEVLLIGLLGLTACSNGDTILQTEEPQPKIFEHPVFVGFSEICLPYIKAASLGESFSDEKAVKSIKTLTQNAGFKKGEFYRVTHRNSDNVYLTGNKAHGAEVEARPSNNYPSRYCKSSFGFAKNYPSLEDFTSWLSLKDPAWVLGSDDSVDKEHGKTISVTFCKANQSEFGQILRYSILDKKLEPRRLIHMSVSIHILQDRPCVRQ